MKKKLFLIMTLLLMACCGINAQTVIISPPPPPKPKGLTEFPEVRAYYMGDTLTVNITGYYGDVEVTIEDATNSNVVATQTEYISWQGTIATDIHNLTTGYYVLYIRLDNDEYTGYFSK